MWRVLAVVVSVLVLVVVVDSVRLWRGINRVDARFPGAGAGATNFLLVGSDSREFVAGGADGVSFGSGDSVLGQHADMMMLVHVPAAGPAVVMGIPRDLVVDFAGSGMHRLTMALGQSTQVLVDAFCSGLGVGLDHVVIVDFRGFRDLIDLEGGVEVDISAPLRDPLTGLDIPAAGRHNLDGTQALALARSRHSEEFVGGVWRPVAEGSKGRVERGASILTALAPGVKHRSESWWGMHQLLGAVSGSVTIDTGAGRGDASQLAAALGSVSDRKQTGGMVQLPAVTLEGPVPVASFGAGAGDALAGVGAGTNPGCRFPNIPATAGGAGGDTITPATVTTLSAPAGAGSAGTGGTSPPP